MKSSCKGEKSADSFEAGIDTMIELQRSILELETLKGEYECRTADSTCPQSQNTLIDLNQRLRTLEESKKLLSEYFASRFAISPVRS